MPRSEFQMGAIAVVGFGRFQVNGYGDNFCFLFQLSLAESSSTITMFALLTVTLAVLALSPTSASITCRKVGETATAKWTNAADKNCTWTGIVGSNFGIDPVNGGK